jgi:4-amino-4-deoxy-L-arabinose transferase-like glycosyltransferase
VRQRRWEPLVLAGTLALAAWLRFRHLNLVEFKLDEMNATALARKLLDGTFPTVGLASSVGALNPPLFVYLIAIPLAVDDDPLAATAFVGLLAVVAVGLTYAVLRPRFGALAALAASALLATAPWAVLAGRKIWAQNLLPLVTVLLLWSLFLVLERRRTRAVLLVPVLLCLAFQLNFSALALVVPVAAVLAYRARAVNWTACALGIAGAVLLLSPWLWHEAGVGFDDVRTLATEGRGGSGSSFPGLGSLVAARWTARITGGFGWDYVAGTSRPQLVDEAGAAWTLGQIASFLGVVLLAAGVVTCAARVARGTRRADGWPWLELDPDAARRATLLVWLLGAWLSYFASATGRVFPHYLLVTYPVSFAVQGLALSDGAAFARGRLGRAATGTAAATLAVTVAGFVAFTLAFQHFVGERGGAAGDYGVVYRDKEALARAAGERGLRVNDRVIEFLVPKPHALPSSPRVVVRDRFVNHDPLPCRNETRTFGPLEACFP